MSSKIELHGLVAYPGNAKGKAFIVNYPHIPREPDGDILVSESTNPEMTIIMGKSKAIATEIGGLLSHSAIVARELKIPCVVGVKGILDAVETGDLVEVKQNGKVIVYKDNK